MSTCEDGCDEQRIDDYEYEQHEPPKFGCCLPPGECCMPGLHFPSECHTADDYEREQFGGLASDAGPRQTPNGEVHGRGACAESHAAPGSASGGCDVREDDAERIESEPANPRN
ncbi:MAG: hypothetical protein JNM98_19355 [Rhodocyclaceae bacterium]|nr:hypothetical protein [Rhodocyclaceae bacterium]